MLCHDYVIPFLWGGAPTACRNTLDKHRTHFYKKHDRRFAVSKIPSCCSWGSVRRGSLCVYIAPRASHWWTMLRWGEVVAVVKASWKNVFCFKSLSEIQLVSVEVVNEESHPPKIYFKLLLQYENNTLNLAQRKSSSLAGCHGTLGHVPAGRWMEINRAVWGDAMITTFQMHMTMAHHDLISLLEKEARVSGRYYNNLQYLGSF